jgi:S1-C subfamily serine protease
MAFIPPFFMDCVAAVGTQDAEGAPRWIASGFFYGYYDGQFSDGRKRYRTHLVTNRHVLTGLSTISLRLNPRADVPARPFGLRLSDPNGFPLWTAHPEPEIDVAVIGLDLEDLQRQGIQLSFFRSDEHAAPTEGLRQLGVTEGDSVYVLGFPMGLGLPDDRRNTVVVRGGCVAKIRDVLADPSEPFLVDAFVFPGNSGGPVVLRPDLGAIPGTKVQQQARLIGIVESYVPYADVAISLQTGRPRVTFEENSGLAAVWPVGSIDQTIQAHLQRPSGSAQWSI